MAPSPRHVPVAETTQLLRHDHIHVHNEVSKDLSVLPEAFECRHGTAGTEPERLSVVSAGSSTSSSTSLPASAAVSSSTTVAPDPLAGPPPHAAVSSAIASALRMVFLVRMCTPFLVVVEAARAATVRPDAWTAQMCAAASSQPRRPRGMPIDIVAAR